MSNNNMSRFLAILGAAALLSSGCRKDLAYLESGQTDCKACNILQVRAVMSDELGTDTVFYRFAYNSFGDPVTIRNTRVATGNPNSVFLYDKHERLTAYIRPYENEAFETWTKYVYNARDQVIRDTEWLFGEYVDSVPTPLPYTGVFVRHYTYDALDRVATRTDTIYGPGSQVYSYPPILFQYDRNGDLIAPGLNYDSHLSWLRTNKIWMFIYDDYSVNNNFQASAYNAHGLPLIFPAPDYEYNFSFGLFGLGGTFDVTYSCK
ncbi:MAG TPA: hypothetical protein VMH27_23075 [Puia sp.]|nr:hypothetical protein [Puia sp.]